LWWQSAWQAAVWAAWQRQRQDPWLRLLAIWREKNWEMGLHLPAHSTPRQLSATLENSGVMAGH
jgi:hypothetical protein